jgi:hypothetical protein
MIYGNTNPKNKTGDVDSFNKKKLADEAKREKDSIRKSQQDQAKRKLQIRIDNLTRELNQFLSNLRIKEAQLTSLKREVDRAKKETLLFREQKIKTEVAAKNLAVESEVDKNLADSSEKKLADKQTEEALKKREITDLEFKYNTDQAMLTELDKKIDWLKYELADLLTKRRSLERTVVEQGKVIRIKKEEEKMLKQDRQILQVGAEQNIKTKKYKTKDAESKKRDFERNEQELVLKERLVERLEMNADQIQKELDKLKDDKTAKEREINELKVQRDTIII